MKLLGGRNMSKKILLASAVVLGTISTFATSTVNVSANQIDNTNNGSSSVIVGPKVDKADTSVTLNSAVIQASSINDQIPIVQGAVNATPAQQQAFLSKVVPIAQQQASKYNLYTSVMLAQSILESNWGLSSLATQANNYFGIKGYYGNATYVIKTNEWSAAKGTYVITANFKKYPNIETSFADNGDKLRNGVSWDSARYKGAWKENTSSYKDATAWLQGRYATSYNYASSLNNVIQAYNLTQYDGTSQTNASSKPTNVISVNNKNASYVPLTSFDNAGNGTLITNHALANNTPWLTDQTRSYNGHTYYRVATNEWVEDSFVK